MNMNKICQFLNQELNLGNTKPNPDDWFTCVPSTIENVIKINYQTKLLKHINMFNNSTYYLPANINSTMYLFLNKKTLRYATNANDALLDSITLQSNQDYYQNAINYFIMQEKEIENSNKTEENKYFKEFINNYIKATCLDLAQEIIPTQNNIENKNDLKKYYEHDKYICYAENKILDDDKNNARNLRETIINNLNMSYNEYDGILRHTDIYMEN